MLSTAGINGADQRSECEVAVQQERQYKRNRKPQHDDEDGVIQRETRRFHKAAVLQNFHVIVQSDKLVRKRIAVPVRHAVIDPHPQRNHKKNQKQYEGGSEKQKISKPRSHRYLLGRESLKSPRQRTDRGLF